MYIKNVYIKNFRNFKEANIPLNPYTTIIGDNDVGKTNSSSSFTFLIILLFIFYLLPSIKSFLLLQIKSLTKGTFKTPLQDFK